jgi:putative flavoprotein involved in K+ transport
MNDGGIERLDTVVIGGGQAGLATAHALTRRGVPVVVLDQNARVGDAWRTRWDSLRLFTPARYDGLPGLRFPAPKWTFPTKDEMADYLVGYADRFEIPVRTNVSVDRIWREGDAYAIGVGDGVVRADHVVVATGVNRIPKVPDFADRLPATILQLHSSEYRNPSQLLDGDVLLVGAGNSGAEIAFELSRSRHVILAGREPGHIPFRHSSASARTAFRFIRFFGVHVATRRTPVGRRLHRAMASKGDPLIRVRPKDLSSAGVERVGRVVGVRDGRPETDDGRALDVRNVIWCTGYRHDFSWIDLPVFDERGEPIHRRGVVEREPGLYFVGLRFQFAVASDVLPGVGRDADFVARRLAARRQADAASAARMRSAISGMREREAAPPVA